MSAMPPPGTLWLVGTPIGNLKDLSDRARDVLAGADVIACEDTRHTRKLLSHFGIRASRLLSFYEGNERSRIAEFLPRKPGGRRARLESLRREERTLVVYESPRRVEELLRDALDALGDRRAAL